MAFFLLLEYGNIEGEEAEDNVEGDHKESNKVEVNNDINASMDDEDNLNDNELGKSSIIDGIGEIVNN